MPKPIREFTKEPDALPEVDGADYVLTFAEFTVDAGARAMYRRWQSTDDELRDDWETADPDLKEVFKKQFRTGLAGAIRDVGQTTEEATHKALD